jgi:hypothetical protein
MSIERAVLVKLRALPPDKQQEVLDFVEFLEHRVPEHTAARRPADGLPRPDRPGREG